MTSIEQKPKAFDGRKQDHGDAAIEDGIYRDDWEDAYNRRNDDRNAEFVLDEATQDGLDEHLGTPDPEVQSEDEKKQERVAQLKEQYPHFAEVSGYTREIIDRELEGDVSSWTSALEEYQYELSERSGIFVPAQDAKILLEALIEEAALYRQHLDEDEAHDLNDTVYNEAYREDEAHDMNETINRVVRGEDWVEVDAARPVHRKRNRNLIRVVENLVDPQDDK